MLDAVDPVKNIQNRSGRPRGVKNRTAAALDSGEVSAIIEWGISVANRFRGFQAFQPPRKKGPPAPFNIIGGEVRANRGVSFGRAVRFVDDVIARLRDEHKVPAAEAEEVRRSAPLWLRVDEPDVRDKRYASAVRELFNDDVRNAENDQYPTPPIGYSAVHVPIIVAWLVEISSRAGVSKAAQAKLRAAFTKELELARPAAWEKFGEMLAAHGWGPVDSADAIGTIEQVPPKAEA